MLDLLIKFALAQRGLVLSIAFALLVFSFKKASDLPVDVLPDLTKPTIILMTECPGFSPEEVEKLVTIPLENALIGTAGVSRLRSINDISLSLIYLEFSWDTKIYQARQWVQERLTNSSEKLPSGIFPYMTPVASLMGNIMLIGLNDPSGTISPTEIRTLADWKIAKKIQTIPGIAEVLSIGGGVRQIHIQPNPNKMMAHGIDLEEILQAARQATKNTSGGFLIESNQEIMVRNLAMTSDLDSIGKTIVDYRANRPILLKDVCSIQWEVKPMRGDAGLGSKSRPDSAKSKNLGHPGVIISITKSPGFDTLELTEIIKEQLFELEKTLPKTLQILPLYDQSDFIHLAIGNLKEALLDGALVVAIVLLLFLLNFRITLITLTAIPLSLGITILVFDLCNLSVNSMTLGGLAVSIGIVVDDAIVDVENVFRRLRENKSLSKPKSRLQVIANASAEVRSSIFYATALIVLAFLPLLALRGLEGRLFSPIAIATMVSMAASFVVSLTVIPVLCSYLIDPQKNEFEKDPFLARTIKTLYKNTWLRFSLSQPLILLFVCFLLVIAAFATTYTMGGNFLPPFREPTAVIATTTAPGTSLKKTSAMADLAQEILLQIPEVETVGYRAGRAEKGDHIVPVSTVEFEVQFKDSKRTRSEIFADLRVKMKSIPGTFSAISSPLADRVGHMLSGVPAKIAIKVFGQDLDTLKAIGQKITDEARKIPGLEEARLEQQALIPQLRIEIDRDRALSYGVTPGAINEQLGIFLAGKKVAQVYDEHRVYDIVVRLGKEWREDVDKLRTIQIHTPRGKVSLSSMVSFNNATGPNAIMRENTQRRIVVSINPTGSDLNKSVEALQSKVEDSIQLPEGYHLRFEGEYQAQLEAKKTIFILSAIILLLIAFLLYNHFKSVPLVLLVLTIIPISLIGSVFFTKATLDNISVATLVGFIAIAGISARNNIMLISHYIHLIQHEGEHFSRSMIERGTLERVVPILMTALSAGVALIPFVLASEEPGKEILNPVSIVIVGGLLSSTIIGLGLTPALFYTFCKKTVSTSNDVNFTLPK